jgi:peptide/nickel transport system permease protein
MGVQSPSAPRRLKRDGNARTSGSLYIGLAGLSAFVLAAIAAPWLMPYDPAAVDLLSALRSPSLAHPFGTDQLGRDILTRVVYGARADLQIGFIGVFIPLTIGTAMGLISGYFRGWVDTVIGRLIDIIMAFPFLVLVIAIVAMLGPGLVNLYIAISVVSWVLYARIVRGETMAIRPREYILAAEGLGYGHLRIMLRHILPNAIAPALIFGMSDFILDLQAGATLSFFGLGVQPPTAEWGLMISETRSFMLTAPWTVIFPGLAIIVVSFFVSLIGDGFADRIRGVDGR